MTVRTSFRMAGATGLAAGLTLGGSVFMAGAASAAPGPAVHVTICHALGSPDTAGNGYNVIAPSATGVIEGHANWRDNAPVEEGGDEGHLADVIPPFEYVDESTGETHSFPGQNWDNNWAVNALGVAAAEVDEDDCTTDLPTSTTSTSTSTSTPPTSTTTTSTTSTPPMSTTTTSTTSTSTPPMSTTSASTTHTPPVVTPTNPAGPQTPGTVQTDGGPMGGDSDGLLGALGIAALLGAVGAAGVIGSRAASRRH